MNEPNEKIFSLLRKIMFLAAIVATVVAVCITLFNAFDLWKHFETLESTQEWFKSFGGWGLFVYGIIVLLQVVVLPIPSTLTNIAAIAVFQDMPWAVFFVTTGCTLVGSFVCFYLGRWFGKKVVSWLVGKEKTEKYAEVLNRGRLLFIMMMLLPCFPDDVLCMVAGLSSMKLWYFAIVIALTRPIMIALITFLGGPVIDALDTWGLPVSIGILILVVGAAVLVMFLRDKKGKEKKKDALPPKK